MGRASGKLLSTPVCLRLNELTSQEPIVGTMSVYDAKARFSEIVERAQKGEPTIITKRGRVVAKRQAVEHRRGALRSAIARIRARRRKRNRAGTFEHTSRGFQQQPHLPVTRVIPERDWRSIRRADAAMR